MLALDPDFLEQLDPYFKKTFRIELSEPALDIDLRPCPDGFIVELAGENEPDVRLRGTLWAFAQLAKQGSHSEIFAEGKITMSGDAELGQAFQRTLSNLQIDWEELSTGLIGDLAARKLQRTLGEFGNWFNQSSQLFRENTGEFFQEELKVVPSKVEVDDLTDKIEILRADTARLEARLAKLRASLNSPEK